MSIKSKNLEYDHNEPAFLRRIRGEIGGIAELEGERSAARLSRRGKVEQTDDDAPAYVMDGSNDTLTKDEYEALLSAKDASTTNQDGTVTKDDIERPKAGDASESQPSESAERNVTDAGRNPKKRKIGKVIRDADENEGANEAPYKTTAAAKKVTNKPKKPKKAIKLSFDAD